MRSRKEILSGIRSDTSGKQTHALEADILDNILEVLSRGLVSGTKRGENWIFLGATSAAKDGEET